MNISRLANSMATVLSLSIHRGVPVRVVEDDGIGTGEIDAKSAGTRRQDKHKNTSVGVEALHHNLAHLDASGAVQPEISVAVITQELLEDVEHARHLREDEAPVTAAAQLPEQRSQRLELAAVVLDETLLRKANAPLGAQAVQNCWLAFSG